MNVLKNLSPKEHGFSAIEFLIASVVFGILVTGITSSYLSIRKSYRIARQLNEIYTVLSACPEIDRALEFNAISGTSNCYPNNNFVVENNAGGTITYSPTLSVEQSSALPVADPLRLVPDSKVLSISVGYPQEPNSPPLELRMLITRNGVGQQ
ncbi:prepilin-type N-terminal cleavage/methylation domain-containing protein [Candidatus Saccharibacteria bacterium]|nr:prepilin-type N-terminal cleavage/methylation domain-containing protein [Candidatus Saccharibacteria bacterium]